LGTNIQIDVKEAQKEFPSLHEADSLSATTMAVTVMDQTFLPSRTDLTTPALLSLAR